MTVDTLTEDPRWEEFGLEATADVAIRTTLLHLGLDERQWDVSLLGCNDARISELNGEFRGKSQATNVLSWPSAERGAKAPGNRPDPPDKTDPELGDIAIAFETCAREAEAAGRPFQHHVTHLLVHGTLHLLGFDHENEADARLMETLEVEILATLGVPDPY